MMNIISKFINISNFKIILYFDCIYKIILVYTIKIREMSRYIDVFLNIFWMVMRLPMEQNAYGSSPGPVKSDTMLPMAHHLWDISLTKALLSGNNKLIIRYGVVQPVQPKFDLIFDIILEKDSIDLLRNHLAQNLQCCFVGRLQVQTVRFKIILKLKPHNYTGN